MSLATKYRPTTLDTIVGQDSIIKILSRQIEINAISNSYIFVGASGSGKTTTARAFARALNGSLSGVLELDAASNNGVDNIRALVKQSIERSLDAKYKIIILDECHALTAQAWQALLKTIEEPSAFTIFIFCTTEANKIPATIINRAVRFNFNKIPSSDIEKRLNFICSEEKFINFNETTAYISRNCKNQLRDGIAMLEKCAAYSEDLCINNAINVLGGISNNELFLLVNGIIDGNEKAVIESINNMYNAGVDISIMYQTLIGFVLNIIKFIIFKDISVTYFSQHDEKALVYTCSINNNKQYFTHVLDSLIEGMKIVKTTASPFDAVTIILLRLCR